MSRPRKIVVSSRAQEDAMDGAFWLLRNSEIAASRFFDAFDATIAAIAQRPMAGEVVENAAPSLVGCRSWPL